MARSLMVCRPTPISFAASMTDVCVNSAPVLSILIITAYDILVTYVNPAVRNLPGLHAVQTLLHVRGHAVDHDLSALVSQAIIEEWRT